MPNVVAAPRPRAGRTDAGRRLALAALVAFAGVVCLMMLAWPLGYDQGVFVSNGDALVRGGAPYRDAWDVKGPLVFYLTALVELVFGRHAWGLRAADVLVALATSAMLWARLRTLASPAVALTAAALWPVLVASQTYDESAQYDLWVGTLALGAVLLATRPGGARARDLLGAGALLGLAALVKPIFPVLLAAPGLAVLVRRARARPRGAWHPLLGDAALLAAGAAVPVAVVLALLAAQGVLGEAWAVHVLYNLRVYAPPVPGQAAVSPLANRVAGLTAFVSQAKVAVALPLAAAGLAALVRRDRALAAAAAAWVALGVALVLLQNKFWPYHWAVVYPSLLLLAAVGVHALVGLDLRDDGRGAPARDRGVGRAAAYGTAAVAVALWALEPGAAVPELKHWLLYAAGRRSAPEYYAHFRRFGGLDPADEMATAEYVRAHSPPGAPFAHWTIDPALPFLADRPNIERFQNKRELIKTRGHPITEAYRREYLARVAARRPTLVVLGRTGDLPDSVATSPEAAAAREFPELAALVAERYAPAARFGDLTVYRLRDAAQAQAPAQAPAQPPTQRPGT